MESVRKAIATGRLSRSVVDVAGQKQIRSAEEADREWAANTRAERQTDPQPPAAATSRDVPGIDVAVGNEEADGLIDFNEARRRHEIEKWRQAKVKREGDELELAKRKGELLQVADARAEVESLVTEIRTKLLGVPSRARQRIPSLTASDVTVIEDLIREAMEAIANAVG